MDSRNIIARNSPWWSGYSESSFTALLHEKGIWQRDQYWLLEWALHDLLARDANIEELYGPVFHIFGCAMNAIASHLDADDFYEISNLSREQIHEFRERIKLVFEGFFAKRLPVRATFDEVNPLLPSEST